MKMKLFTVIVLVIAVLALSLMPVAAHDYDRNDTDYPLRYVAYLVHPIGVALEYTVTRPFHKLVHNPTCAYIMGHEIDYKTENVEDIELAEPEAEMAFDSDEEVPEDLAPSACLSPDRVKDDFEITAKDGEIRYTVVDGPVLFKEGSASLTDDGKVVVDKIASRIGKEYSEREIVVEGHTDSQPIKESGWESNWELGAARALQITEYLIEKHEFNPEKVAAKTFAQYKAAASNDTPEGRQANRRAVIVVKAEPQK